VNNMPHHLSGNRLHRERIDSFRRGDIPRGSSSRLMTPLITVLPSEMQFVLTWESLRVQTDPDWKWGDVSESFDGSRTGGRTGLLDVETIEAAGI